MTPGWRFLIWFGGLFVLDWDKWDKILLRNTRSRLKRLFRVYYRNRDFTPSGLEGEPSPGTIWIAALREAFRPAPGKNLLPWWKKGQMRSNPYNANDELCKNKD